MEAPGFWDDAEKAQKYVLELNALKSDITKFSDLHSEYEDLMTLIEMGFEENDQAIVEEVESEYNKFIHSMLEQAEQSRVTGQRCSLECTEDMQIRRALVLKYWTFSLEMRQE